MDRPDPFRWLQRTAALAVILTDTYTNLVRENTVRIAIAPTLLFLGTIIKSHKMGYARKEPVDYPTRKRQTQISSRFLPLCSRAPGRLAAGLNLHFELCFNWSG